jgi:hypothetical protein
MKKAVDFIMETRLLFLSSSRWKDTEQSFLHHRLEVIDPAVEKVKRQTFIEDERANFPWKDKLQSFLANLSYACRLKLCYLRFSC